MKKFWKALGIAALAAAVPVRFKKNETTGKKKFQSLLISVDVTPNQDGEGTDIGINIGEGVLTEAISNLVDSKRETIHFADNEPEAAVVYDMPEITEAGKSAEAEEPAETAEADFDPEG